MTDTPPGATLDAFQRGSFWLLQPDDRGHRAGIDALIVGSAVPKAFSGRLADFGAGAGAAGLAVAARCATARVTLVENAPDMVGFARASLALHGNAVLQDRVEVLQADVSLTGRPREAAGLTTNSFDGVIMNPPFNVAGDRGSPDALRRQAHVMPDGLLDAWVRSAAAVVRSQGLIAIIARPVSLPAVLSAFNGRFGAARVVPVHPRPEDAAIRVVVRATRASRAVLSLCPPLVLHGSSGSALSARAQAISDGQTSLFHD